MNRYSDINKYDMHMFSDCLGPNSLFLTLLHFRKNIAQFGPISTVRLPFLNHFKWLLRPQFEI